MRLSIYELCAAMGPKRSKAGSPKHLQRRQTNAYKRLLKAILNTSAF